MGTASSALFRAVWRGVGIVGIVCTLLLAALFVLPAHAAGMRDFLGMRWNDSLADLQTRKTLVQTKAAAKDGASLYALRDDTARFGAATLAAVQCTFVHERLQGILLLFEGEQNYQAMRKEAFKRMGEGKKSGQGQEEVHNWLDDTTNAVLSYNTKDKAGFLYLKPGKAVSKAVVAVPTPPEKKKPDDLPPAKPATDVAAKASAAPEPAPAEASALDRFDQASGIAAAPTTAETSPEGKTVDGKTALDLVSPSTWSPPASAEISAEIQGLIDRDQALNRLCWSGSDPRAQAACQDMRTSAEQLMALGMCMSSEQSGGAVVWQPCATPDSATPDPGSPATGAQARCLLVGELFDAAARLRASGVQPLDAEQELVRLQEGRAEALAMPRIRETVELIYFDPAWATPLPGDQAARACQAGSGPFAHPLPPP
ncbi:MAG: hypothetical protein ACOX5Z_00750 [Desulfobulbus sp.]|jgi:hypothetical protein